MVFRQLPNIFPLTRNQREIYFEQLLHPKTSIFNIGATTTIDGTFEPELLVSAIRQVYRSHPEPNTTVFEEDGRPLQHIAPRDDFSPSIIDFSRHTHPEQEAHRYIERHFQEPLPFGFDASLSAAMVLVINPQRHIMYTKFHHIIWDGWSLSLLYRRFVEEYNRMLRGEPETSPGDCRFEKFIEMDEHYAATEAFQRDRRYWEARLAAPAPSYYPVDERFAYESGHQSLVLPREKLERITTLARQENCSAFHFIIAILFSSIAHTHHTYDFDIALPILNRRSREAKKTMGYFVNILPLRLEAEPHWSFRTLLRQIAFQLARDYRHGRFPAGHLLRKREDLSSAPHRGEISLSYEKLGYDYDFDGCRNKVTPLNTRQQVRPLQIFLREYDRRDDAYLDFDHNLSFIDHRRMREMIRRFDELTDRALDNPDEMFCAPRYSPSHYARGATDARERVATDLVSMFERQAALHPDRIAVSHGLARLSYAQLNSLANQLARLLRARGIHHHHTIALSLHRSPSILVAILAVLKSGAAYLPLDPSYPSLRLHFLLHDSRPDLLLLARTPAASALAQDAPCAALFFDDLLEQAASLSPDNLGLPIDPAQAAYVIYTSGSTGEPKGCVVTHANVTRLLQSAEREMEFGCTDVWTMFHSYAFDFSVWEIWGALLYGGRVVVVEYWESREPEEFYKLLVEEGVTVLNQTPSAFRQLLQVEAQEGEQRASELSLRLLIFGGEMLEFQCLGAWFARHGDERPKLVNMYGITETTVHVTRRFLRSVDVRAGQASLIGEPLDDVRVYLLDTSLRPTTPGVKGEIYVGGAGVARGYLHRPALTAERFLPDPFCRVAGARMYRSGDIGRRRADGELEYIGRADSQVKIRGFRIEPGEVEAVVRGHKGVGEAVVLATGTENTEKRLVCYVSLRDGVAATNVAELRRHAQQHLPEHMVPAAFMIVERLPLNENGKVDRRALAQMEWSVNDGDGESFVGARDGREGLLAQVWSEVLGVERIGIDSNFFNLGGDSIMALQLAARARQQGFQVTFKDIYERPTIRALVASSIESSPDEAATHRASPLVGLSEADFARLPADVEDAFPLSSLQAGMLYHTERAPGSAIFHDIFSYRLETMWDEHAWKKALDELASAHPSLRTSFNLGGYSEALQFIHRAAAIPCIVTDLRGRSREEQQREIGLQMEREKADAFSFERPPLLRVHVHLLDENRIQFTISFHHAALDGWSVATLVTQLFLLYAGRRKSLAARKDNDFRAFVYTEKEALANDTLRRFWLEELKRMPTTHLAAPRHTQSRGGEVRRRAVVITDELNERLIQMSQRCAVPLKTVLLAAHVRVLSDLSGQERASTGYVTHSRPESDDVETLGLFLNTLPFAAPAADCSWVEFVQRVFTKEKELLPRRSYPLASIKDLNHGRMPFDVGFNYVQFHVYNALRALDGLKVLDFQIYEETDFPLLAQFTRHFLSMAVELTLVSDSHSFTTEQMDVIARLYVEILTRMTGEPEAQARVDASSVNCETTSYALPAPRFLDTDAHFVPPSNDVQEKLVLLYEEVLDVQPVGIRHSFFDLGGNSILATRLVARIRHLFRIDLPLNALFENPDIERLSACLSALAAPDVMPMPPAISPARRKLSTIKISDSE